MMPDDGAARVLLVVETYKNGEWIKQRDLLAAVDGTNAMDVVALLDYVLAIKKLPRPVNTSDSQGGTAQ